MLFPYLELPVALGYADSSDTRVVKGKFLPNTITCYHEGFMPDVGMFIYVAGQPFQIALTMEQYEQQIAAYWNLLGSKKDIKAKLGIVQ